MKIQLHLNSTWWDQAPNTEIWFDEILLWKGQVDTAACYDFDVDISQRSQSSVMVRLLDKDIMQTVVSGSQIVKDQLLHIEKLIIDDIDIENLIFSAQYYPKYPEHMLAESRYNGTDLPKMLDKINTLGWNGDWRFDFYHPFDIWYLENLP